jgi:hypothetical protein
MFTVRKMGSPSVWENSGLHLLPKVEYVITTGPKWSVYTENGPTSKQTVSTTVGQTARKDILMS